MILARFAHPALFVSLLLAAAPASAQSAKELDEAMGFDGLRRAQVKGLDLAYTRPGASLAPYKKVWLDPVQVSFHRDWDPKRTGSRLKLSTQEKLDIRDGVGKVVHEEFVKALRAQSRYELVNAAGPDVLRVTVKILNLYVNAPDASAPRSGNLTMSAGEMTMFTELHDSESGQTLARVVDRREGRNTGLWTISNTVSNTGEAQAIAASWARILRDGLDKAGGAAK